MLSSVDWSRANHPEIVFNRFNSRRSVVYGTKGMVACSQPLAAQAGLDILKRGGNALDAAVATSAALNVTEPSCCGIGGDAFCLFYDAGSKSIKALNGSGRSPRALNLETARSKGIKGDSIKQTDLNSVTVPGAAAAWVDSVEAFGSGKLTLADILAPAISLAEEGVPVSELHSRAWQMSENLIKNASADAHAMLLDGKAPLPGQVMRFPDLAKTFRTLASEGKDGFYKGRIAKAITELIQSKGGVMNLEDLATHRTDFVEPLGYTYRGLTLWECPPNGQGITALLALGILEAAEEERIIKSPLEMKHNSTEYLHTVIEALRLAFADTRYYVTDPDIEHVPVKELLSKEYLKTRAKLFNPQKAVTDVHHGNPVQSSDTVYFSVTDQWGNAASFIQSNYAGFGTGAIPHECGFTLQNRGSCFTLKDGHPNVLMGGKRPYHTIIPALVTRGDELWMSFGCMGGFNQPQGQLQILFNVLRGWSIQDAIDAPRFCISAGMPDSGQKGAERAGDINSEVYFEPGISEDVLATLKDMGHDVQRVTGFGSAMMGRAQIIQKLSNPSGKLVWAASSDPRGDGHAVPQI